MVGTSLVLALHFSSSIFIHKLLSHLLSNKYLKLGFIFIPIAFLNRWNPEFHSESLREIYLVLITFYQIVIAVLSVVYIGRRQWKILLNKMRVDLLFWVSYRFRNFCKGLGINDFVHKIY
jgi:uncharacterized membrane protein